MESENVSTATARSEAFQYLKSLPRNELKITKSWIIDMDVAQSFTDTFRMTSDVFTIPISWSLTKSALISLLGITDFNGFNAISGIRLYAGLNDDRQMTLIAVAMEPDINDPNNNNDLTINDEYPYYEYADPCPSNCSSTGNLRSLMGYTLNMNFIRHGHENLVSSYGGEKLKYSAIEKLKDNTILPCIFFIDSEDIFEIDDIYTSLKTLLYHFDIEIIKEQKAIRGSWIKKTSARFRTFIESDTVQKKLHNIEDAINKQTLDKPQSEIDLNKAKAVAELLKSVENVNTATFKIGDLTISKTEENGISKVIAIF